MIPHVITPFQREVAELYWGTSWTNLSAPQVQEAMVWWMVQSSLVPVSELRFPDTVRP